MAEKKKKRFVRVYNQSSLTDAAMTIYVDTVTGVNYLFSSAGYSGGITPLLDRDGKPVISALPILEED